jgi:hypothetical protein
MENAMKILKENSVFWSKLGFCYDPPRLDKDGKPIVFFENFERFIKFHKDFAAAGIKLHTSILFSGWTGVNRYDYELTDRVLDAILKDNPDIYYIPRIKLNVPLDWGKENPEEIFVYFDGPREVEEIQRLVGTEKHDFLGYESATGYYTAGGWKDDRPNVGGVISNQSFSSQKWLLDAGETLCRLIHHIEQGPYKNQVIAYHIAYGTSGETCLWGRCSNKFGDYGISNRRSFFDWGLKQYGTLETLRNAWSLPDLDRDNAEPPPPERRQSQPTNLRAFFRTDDCICVDYDRFTTEVNVNAIEHFGKLVKENTGGKPVGCFYGYFLECHNAAYTGWLGYERILNSPYVDFMAAPKSYYRTEPGEPGGELGPAQSVNLRKLWMDELDNRTHIAQGVGIESKSANMDETRTVMWREFAKNMAHGSGFWWMDLGGGWFDDPEILREIALIEKTAAKLRSKTGKSIAEILLVVDEESIYHTVSNCSAHAPMMLDAIRSANLCGAPTDMYRLNDLETLDLSQYKLIIFINSFKLLPSQWRRIETRIPQHATLIWNYAPGVLNPGFSIDNIEKITGIKVRERRTNVHPQILPQDDSCLAGTGPLSPEFWEVNKGVNYRLPEIATPLLEVVLSDEIRTLAHYEDGAIAIASRKYGGRNVVYAALPFFGPEHLRRIAALAGCHLYAPANCAVYADSRFIGIFSKIDLQNENLEFRNKVSLESPVTGRRETSVNSVTLNLKSKGMEFFAII